MKRQTVCMAVFMGMLFSVFAERLTGNPFVDPGNKFTLNYTIAPNELEDLALSSKYIAWGRNTLNVYDRGTSSLLPIVTSTQEIKDNITISDNFVAWKESPSDDIFVHDLNNGNERLLGHGVHPVLTPDNRVFWYDPSGGPDVIKGYDLNQNLSLGDITGVGTVGGAYGSIAVSGDLVVWSANEIAPNDPEYMTIYGRCLSSGSNFQISDELFPNDVSPSVTGNYVAWTFEGGGLASIRVHNLAGGGPTSVADKAIAPFSSHNNRIVWSDFRNGQDTADIYGYDYNTDTQFPISLDPGQQHRPVIYDNDVIWFSPDGNGNYVIEGNTIIPEPITSVMLTLGGLILRRKRCK